MSKEIEIHNQKQLSTNSGVLAAAGQVANKHAAANAFGEYQRGLAANSRSAQMLDLAMFADFLAAITNEAPLPLFDSPSAWAGITHGLIEAFRNEHLNRGYSIGTVNRRLATVKKYAGLAFKAGVIDATESALIKTVNSFSPKKARNIDNDRKEAGIDTRKIRESKPNKKADSIAIPFADIERLKSAQENTPQGRRDALLMCLLLEHGLRASEAAALTVGSIDLKAGTMRFYRQKVDKTQTHNLTADTLKAARAYLKHDAPAKPEAPLLRASKKNGELVEDTNTGLTTRSISRIVSEKGLSIGLNGLSAHDCRHSWATRAAAAGTSPFVLQEAGGWSSLDMPRRYIDEQTVANDGVKLKS
jgi:integrase